MSVSFSQQVLTPGNTVLTTKGDILVHDGTNPVRMPVGTNGYVLKPNTGSSSGLYWAAPPGEGGSSDYEPIAYTAITTDTSSIEFSSITSGYHTLVLVNVVRYDGIQYNIRFNNSSTSGDYTFLQYRVDAGTYDAYETGFTDGISVAQGASTSSATDTFCHTFLMIHNYANTSKYKAMTLRASVANTTNFEVSFAGGQFNKNDAITSIQIQRYGGTQNFKANSTFALYGIK